MEFAEFEAHAKQLIQYIGQYLDGVDERHPVPDVEPGFLSHLVPAEAPMEAEPWHKVFADIDGVVMKGITHQKGAHSHVFTSSGSSHASMLATILSDNLVNYSAMWAVSPFMIELEGIVLDWLVQMMGLPHHYLSRSKQGSGCIVNSGSEGIFTSVLYARERILNSEDKEYSSSTLVAYCSDQAHVCCQRAHKMAFVKSRILPSNDEFQLTGEVLREAIEQDEKLGFKPFHVTVTLGTTGMCIFDPLEEIAKICIEKGVWLHVDAVWAAAAFICPQYRYLMQGVEHADSFGFNPYKWLLVHAPCAVLWVKNRKDTVLFNKDQAFKEDSLVYGNWEWPLVSGRRVKTLNLWFVMRLYGQSGLQQYIEKDIDLVKEMEHLLQNDGRFEVINNVIMCVVCFRIKGHSNEVTKALLKAIDADKKIFLLGWETKGLYFIRFNIVNERTQSKDVHFAYNVIAKKAEVILQNPSGHTISN